MLFNQALEATVLGKIVADKVNWIAERKAKQPLETFQSQVHPTDRSFVQALHGRKAFILECKKASPSKGLIREDFSPKSIARIYRNHASAISVLTDEKYFQGQYEFIREVRDEVDVPVLCKDFIIDPYQIYLARYYQADAILLMLSVLNDTQYRELADLAHSLGMGVLTEAISEDEIQRAIALQAEVIGINNRDLRDLQIDLNRTRHLASLVPADRIVICESGIYHHDQVKELGQFVQGFLVGSSLMAEADLDMACRKLILGHNKVCGLTRPEDALAAYQAGAVYGGLIFAEKSPRYVTLEQARLIRDSAPLLFVGVFQNAPLEQMITAARQLQLSAIQLHGDEPETTIQALKQAVPDCEIWRAIAVSDHTPQLNGSADKFVLDTRTAQGSGGTGQAFDWSLLAPLPKHQLLLAGGINTDNIVAAMQVGCLGLDLNSGAERSPGVKDPEKIQHLFTVLRAY